MYVCAEYIWIGGERPNNLEPSVRSKTRTIRVNDTKRFLELHEVPRWNFDGSSTDLATTARSEVELVPVYVCKDPFRGAPHVLVLCECVDMDGQPVQTNRRRSASKLFTTSNLVRYEPWYGLEQEYVLLSSGVTPFGTFQSEGSLHYCGVGRRNGAGRKVAEQHLQMCLVAGLLIAGLNAEVMQNQWEFQIGPVVGIAAADQLWIARYILLRVAEMHDFDVSFHPKRFPCLSGSGCHTNFSTVQTRDRGDDALPLIKTLHLDHNHLMTQTRLYGQGNALRLTGEFETAPLTRFSYGVGDRTASIRIPSRYTGYIEDRRPAANADPYDVTSYLLQMYMQTCDDNEEQKSFDSHE